MAETSPISELEAGNLPKDQFERPHEKRLTKLRAPAASPEAGFTPDLHEPRSGPSNGSGDFRGLLKDLEEVDFMLRAQSSLLKGLQAIEGSGMVESEANDLIAGAWRDRASGTGSRRRPDVKEVEEAGMDEQEQSRGQRKPKTRSVEDKG